MIELSETLPESKIGWTSVHNLLLNGKRMGYINVSYMQKEDVKMFQRTKRKLKAGQPFSMQVFLDTSSGVKSTDLGIEGLKEIVTVVKEKVKDIEERDIFFLELANSKKNILKRASKL